MSTTASTLSAHLDSLLERYLIILDQHERLRDEARRHFRSGLISLAEANFKSPNRVRYGQDLYDGKMQATLRVAIEPMKPEHEDRSGSSNGRGAASDPAPLVPWTLTAQQSPVVGTLGLAKAKATEKAEQEPSARSGESKDGADDDSAASTIAGSQSDPSTRHVHLTPPSSPESTTTGSAPPGFDPQPEEQKKKKEGSADDPVGTSVGPEKTHAVPSADPIRQFGILVPPALRAAQASFRQSLDPGWIAVAGLDAELKALELEIRQTRKNIKRDKKSRDIEVKT